LGCGNICRKRGTDFLGPVDVGLHGAEGSIARLPLRQKGRSRFGVLLQQRVRHGLPVERDGDSFCLAYTGVRVDDITARREGFYEARSLSRVLREILWCRGKFPGKQQRSICPQKNELPGRPSM
jgi:hypothetical protein